MGKHGPSEQSGYAPMALSSIGPLPRPQMSRCIEFYLVRANEERSKLLRRFDVNDTADLDRTYQITRAWLQTAKIDPDPVMPQGFYGRRGDNWRPLVAVADACSPAWGALIREAMVHSTRGYHDKHILVLLLEHIRDVFDAYGFNTRDGKAVLSKVLVDELNAREDGPWAEWTGILDNQRPRKLTQTALAGLLRRLTPFNIRPRPVWLPGHQESGRGYFEVDLAPAWKAYLDEGATPPQPIPIKRLRRV